MNKKKRNCIISKKEMKKPTLETSANSHEILAIRMEQHAEGLEHDKNILVQLLKVARCPVKYCANGMIMVGETQTKECPWCRLRRYYLTWGDKGGNTLFTVVWSNPRQIVECLITGWGIDSERGLFVQLQPLKKGMELMYLPIKDTFCSMEEVEEYLEIKDYESIH